MVHEFMVVMWRADISAGRTSPLIAPPATRYPPTRRARLGGPEGFQWRDHPNLETATKVQALYRPRDRGADALVTA